MSKDWQKKASELREEGYSNRAIGRKLGKDESVVRRYFKRLGEFYDEAAGSECNHSLGELGEKYKETGNKTYTVDELGTPVYWDTKLGDFTTDGVTNWNPHPAQQKMLDEEPKVLFYGGASIQKAWPMKIKPLRLEEERKKPLSIIVIADTQCKTGISLDYCKWIGQYIFDKKPDVVVHIGDHADCPSLSSYDKGKRSFEGRRLKADLEAAKLGMDYIVEGFKKDGYNPRMVFCLGNHEERLDRLANDMPELSGFVGTELLNLEQYGWEVYPFLKPAVIEDIFFVHFLANPFTGKPYGGSAMSQLKTVGNSFVCGHKQILDIAIRPTLNGKHQIGIINGACLTPDHKILTADLRYIPLGEVKVGQEIVSFDEETKENSHRRFKTGRVTAHKTEKDKVFKVTLSNGKVFKVTDDHLWLVKTGSTYLWKETNRLRKGTRVVKALDEWETCEDYDSGWLAGVYDGEGSYTTRSSGNSICCQLAVSQNEGEVLTKIKEILCNRLQLGVTTSKATTRNCVGLRVKGGIPSIAKFLGTIRPVRLLPKFKPEHLGRLSTTSSENPFVEKVEFLGEMEIVRIAVDAKTMIVEGYAHHNCYLHEEEYKGFQGQNHFRGLTVLHEVEDGFALPSFVSLDYLKRKYS